MAREDWAGRGKQRRIFSQQFKLQVLDSYRRDSDCRGNQRATARKYGIHRRQIQKWLQVEATLRGGPVPSPPAPLDYSPKDRLYSIGLKVRVLDCEKPEAEDRLSEEEEPVLVVDDSSECLDLSKKKADLEEKTLLDLDSPQETALCLVTREPTPPPPSLWPLTPPLCCDSCPPPYPDWCHYPYYSVYHTSCVTKWLHHDAPYYKQAVKDINLYTPSLYS